MQSNPRRWLAALPLLAVLAAAPGCRHAAGGLRAPCRGAGPVVVGPAGDDLPPGAQRQLVRRADPRGSLQRHLRPRVRARPDRLRAEPVARLRPDDPGARARVHPVDAAPGPGHRVARARTPSRKTSRSPPTSPPRAPSASSATTTPSRRASPSRARWSSTPPAASSRSPESLFSRRDVEPRA